MEVLIMKARKKDSEAFIQLMDLNTQYMYKIAKSYLKVEEDVADVLQDTILTCYEKIGTLKQNKYFKTWLTRILINKCKDILGRNKDMYIREEIPEIPVNDFHYDNLEWSQVLQLLDEKYRTILLLYYLEDFNTREIAEMLDMNEKTVQTRLARGRGKISELYQMEERRSSI